MISGLWLSTFFSAHAAENAVQNVFPTTYADLDVVLTPTRLRQPLRDTPASVTVLTGETLKDLGITSIAEAMRLVPGMVVLDAGGHDYRISYHGTNGLVPKRMQLMIDGVSWYREGYAMIEWETLPVSIEEVERIEVTRSPSTPSYGANSFSAVVNIITKHPADYHHQLYAAAGAGSLDTKNAYVRYANPALGKGTALAISFAHRQDDGYDADAAGNPRHDASHFNVARISTVTDLSPGATLTTHLGAAWADLEDQYGDSRQISFPDIDEDSQFGEVIYSRHFNPNHRLDLKLYTTHVNRLRGWRSCVPAIALSDELRALNDANPAYVTALLAGARPSGGTAQDNALLAAVLRKVSDLGPNALVTTCGNVNEDTEEYRYDLELQDTRVFSDELRALMGLGVRQDTSDSETFYSGKVTNTSQRAFFTAEWKPSRPLVFNVGGTLDRDDHLLDGTRFSPRVAMNVHVKPTHTVRFIFSKAIRTPDPLEQDRDWTYTATDLQPLFEGQSVRPYYVHAQSRGGLQPESIKAYEISYYAEGDAKKWSIDLKLFREELTDLISEKPQVTNYNPTNNNAATLIGGEVELRAKLFRKLDLYATFSHVNNNSTTFYEKTLHAKEVGSIALSYPFAQTITANVAYYGNSSIAGTQYERYDLSIRKGFRVGGRADAGLGVTLRYYQSTQTNVWRDVNDFRTNVYDDDLQFLASLELGAF